LVLVKNFDLNIRNKLKYLVAPTPKSGVGVGHFVYRPKSFFYESLDITVKEVLFSNFLC